MNGIININALLAKDIMLIQKINLTLIELNFINFKLCRTDSSMKTSIFVVI